MFVFPKFRGQKMMFVWLGAFHVLRLLEFSLILKRKRQLGFSNYKVKTHEFSKIDVWSLPVNVIQFAKLFIIVRTFVTCI